MGVQVLDDILQIVFPKVFIIVACLPAKPGLATATPQGEGNPVLFMGYVGIRLTSRIEPYYQLSDGIRRVPIDLARRLGAIAPRLILRFGHQ